MQHLVCVVEPIDSLLETDIQPLDRCEQDVSLPHEVDHLSVIGVLLVIFVQVHHIVPWIGLIDIPIGESAVLIVFEGIGSIVRDARNSLKYRRLSVPSRCDCLIFCV